MLLVEGNILAIYGHVWEEDPEIEQIVAAGTKVNIDHCIEETMDEDCVEELFEFFSDSEEEGIDSALVEFGDSYSEEELRLMRIKFLSDVAN